MTALPEPRKRGLPELAGEIRRQHEAVEANFAATVTAALRCGELLTEAKSKVKHGEWYDWLAANFPSTPKTAAVYMRMAANREQIEHAGSIRGALAQLTPAKDETPAPPEDDPPADADDLEAAKFYIEKAERLNRERAEKFLATEPGEAPEVAAAAHRYGHLLLAAPEPWELEEAKEEAAKRFLGTIDARYGTSFLTEKERAEA